MTGKRKDNKKRVVKEGEYQRENGTYEYKWRDPRGKRHSEYAKTLEELREKECEVQRDILDGIRSDKRNLTVNDLYNRWKQLKHGLKDNTFQSYQYLYSQFVESDFGLSRVADLKRTDVRVFYNHLADTHHLKVSTIECIHTVLHQVLELGVVDDYLRYNPSDSALQELKKAHCNDSKKRRALTLDQQRIFEDFLRQPGKHNKWYPIFTVMLWTGLRVGELTGLRWCDVDLEKGTIDVNHTLVYYKYFEHGGKCICAVNTPKTEAGKRIVPMLPKVKEAFLLEKQTHEDFGIECKAVVDNYTDFIFVNRFGDVQSRETLNKALKRIVRDCNHAEMEKYNGAPPVLLPAFSNHILRHTFTTRMCEAGVNIKAMQEILGHADVETTMDIYAEATLDLKRSEMTSFSEYYDKITSSSCV